MVCSKLGLNTGLAHSGQEHYHGDTLLTVTKMPFLYTSLNDLLSFGI